MPTSSVAERARLTTVFDVLLAPLLMLIVGLLGAVVSVSTVVELSELVVLLSPVKIVPGRSLLESEVFPFVMAVSKSLSISVEHEVSTNKMMSICLKCLILYSILFNDSGLPNITDSN